MSQIARPLKYPPIFPRPSGLVLDLQFDERSGAKLYDRSGKGNHGTIYGATWVAGRRGALSFDPAANNYVLVAEAASLKPTEAITIDFLAYPKNVNAGQRFVHHGGLNEGAGIYEVYSYANVLYVRLNNGAVIHTSGTISANIWQRFAVVYNKVDIRTYVNGVLSGTPTAYTASLAYDSGYGLYLGRRRYSASPAYLNGYMGEVRMLSRAPNAAEIKRRYESEIEMMPAYKNARC